MFNLFISFSILLVLFSVPNSQGAFKEIVPSSLIEESSLKLNYARKIPHHCFSQIDENAPLAVWKPLMDCQFGLLSLNDFNYLRETYSGWSLSKTKVKYNDGRHYRLSDFLPPVIQALNMHRFSTQKRPVGHALPQLQAINQDHPDKISAQLTANCWGTVYEILRHASDPLAQELDIFTATSDPIKKLLRQNSTFIMREELSESPQSSEQMQPGDILMIYHTLNSIEYLDHVALFVDSKLLFEKAGGGDVVPYRLIDFETIKKIWPLGVFKYEYRRPHLNRPLKRASTLFGLHNSSLVEKYPQFDLLDPVLADSLTMAIDFKEDMVRKVYYFWIGTIPSLKLDQNYRIKLPASAYQEDAFHIEI